MFTRDTLTQFLENFDEAKRDKLLGAYIDSLYKHIITCDRALETGDAAAMQASVHDIKSLCLMLGAQDEGKEAEAIEHALKAGETVEAFSRIGGLTMSVRVILEVMRTH